MRVISCPYDQALGLGAVAFITSLQGRKTSVHHLQRVCPGEKKDKTKKMLLPSRSPGQSQRGPLLKDTRCSRRWAGR